MQPLETGCKLQRGPHSMPESHAAGPCTDQQKLVQATSCHALRWPLKLCHIRHNLNDSASRTPRAGESLKASLPQSLRLLEDEDLEKSTWLLSFDMRPPEPSTKPCKLQKSQARNALESPNVSMCSLRPRMLFSIAPGLSSTSSLGRRRPKGPGRGPGGRGLSWRPAACLSLPLSSTLL